MKILNLLLLPFAFAVVGVIRLIAPWKVVRFGELWTPRLGHLIGNTECYLCERDEGIQPKDTYDIWIPVPGKTSNKYIARKYKKLLHVWPNWFGSVAFKVNAVFQGREPHVFGTQQVDRDIYNLWEKHAPHIGFTKREERKGQKFLRKLGIPEGAKWVCLIVRDSSYLKVKFPKANWSYHDYRDADVSSYMPAAIELMRRGYYVVRMGEVIDKPFLVKHAKIIDYAMSKKRSEFGDLYLGAKCAFCLGTPTGFMGIPAVFNRPLCMTDMAPIEYAYTWCDSLLIWKHHMKDGKRLTVKEICDANVSQATFQHLFDQAGVTLENNTSEEIFKVAMEMADKVEGNWIAGDQTWFWKTFPTSIVGGAPLHGRMKMRIGREFLKEYQTQNSPMGEGI